MRNNIKEKQKEEGNAAVLRFNTGGTQQRGYGCLNTDGL